MELKTPVAVADDSTTPLTIGSYFDGSVALAVDLGEIRLFDSKLSTTDLNAVGKALAAKWGAVWGGV